MIKKYAVVSVEELDQVDFSQLLDTDADTTRKSVDGTLALLRWAELPFDPTPVQIVTATTGDILIHTPVPQGLPATLHALGLELYSDNEIEHLLNSPEWTQLI